MLQKTRRITAPGFAAGIGAGLASALFSMLVAQKTSLALAMGLISPLPIMIAALGFGSISGFVAVLVGAVAVGLLDLRPEGLVVLAPDKLPISAWIEVGVFAVSLGLPSWLLARLATAPVASVSSVSAGAEPMREGLRPDELRLGRLLAVAAGFAAIGIALDFAVAITKQGGFKAFMADSVMKAEPLVETLIVGSRPLPKGITTHDVAVGVTWAQMPVMSAAALVLLVVNLWLAARTAQASGLLAAPWPDIPRYTRIPRALGFVLAVSLGLAFAGGLTTMISLILSGALVMAFALQGLAVIHMVTRGKSFRIPLLIIVYLSLALLMPWLIIVYGLVGLLDSAFAFRDRPARKPPAPTGPWQAPPPKDH